MLSKVQMHLLYIQSQSISSCLWNENGCLWIYSSCWSWEKKESKSKENSYRRWNYLEDWMVRAAKLWKAGRWFLEVETKILRMFNMNKKESHFKISVLFRILQWKLNSIKRGLKFNCTENDVLKQRFLEDQWEYWWKKKK